MSDVSDAGGTVAVHLDSTVCGLNNTWFFYFFIFFVFICIYIYLRVGTLFIVFSFFVSFFVSFSSYTWAVYFVSNELVVVYISAVDIFHTLREQIAAHWTGSS